VKNCESVAYVSYRFSAVSRPSSVCVSLVGSWATSPRSSSCWSVTVVTEGDRPTASAIRSERSGPTPLLGDVGDEDVLRGPAHPFATRALDTSDADTSNGPFLRRTHPWEDPGPRLTPPAYPRRSCHRLHPCPT
jgi:hypothetical protein